MFEKILVPVDLTPKNRRAVEVARNLALQAGGSVSLLHVIETLDLPFEELKDFYDRLERQALAHMARLTEPLEHAEVPFEAHVLYGDRSERITRFARERAIDLIVMESHRVEPGVPGKGPTTISYRVAMVADCPVLLVKGAEPGSEA